MKKDSEQIKSEQTKQDAACECEAETQACAAHETDEKERLTAERDAAAEEAVKQAAYAEEMKLAAQRLQADFDNYRKRNADAVAKARTDGEGNVIVSLLPALDVFESALAMIADDGVAQGVRMIQRKLMETLAGYGVEQIVSLGADFDPEYHDAIERVASENPDDSGKVISVLQQGYRRGDKVLRPALVKVAE